MRRGTRTLIQAPATPGEHVGTLLSRLVAGDDRLGLLYEADKQRLPEHVEVVLNDRLLDLRGGLEAELEPGDVLTFLPAHAGG